MSGTEPNWNADEQNEEHTELDDLYGAPRATPRPGEETTDEVAPMGSVAPLSIDDEDDDSSSMASETSRDDAAFDADEEPFEVLAEADEPVELGEPSADEPAPSDTPEAPTPLKLAGEDEDEDEDLELGNRPADGARVVSASDIFSEEFMGAEGASDFLGLDTDFDPTPVAGGSAAGFAESQDDVSGGLDLRESPEAAIATDTDAESEAGTQTAISAPEDDPAFAGEEMGEHEDGEFDDELLEEGFEDEEPASGGRRMLVGVAAFVLGISAVGAALYGPQLFEGEPDAVDTAKNTQPTPATTETTDPTATEAGGNAETTGGTEATEPRPIEDFVSTDPGGNGETVEPIEPIELVEPAPVDTTGEVAIDTTDPATDGIDGGEASLPETPDPAAELEALLAQSTAESFYGTNASMLDLVWRGDIVPMDAIFASSRILTPSVGSVRVHMDSTDVFEGRLFAVGEDKVWVDIHLGRIGLDGNAVARIERLPDEVDVEALAAQDLATGHRVRAQVAGGVIYGRVRSVNGTSVTLVTDSGARITLDDPVLEPVGEKKSVVLKL